MALEQKATGKQGTFQKASPSMGLNQFKAEIEKRAKEIFLKRQNSKAAGDALSDWLLAEKEIKAKHHIA
jgi:hypothetical protein